MKVTAILADKLAADVQRYSTGKNITGSIVIALSDWLALKKIMDLNARAAKAHLEFDQQFGAELTRAANRKP